MAGYLETSEFLQDFLAGTEKAFAEVFNAYFRRLYVFAFELTDNEAEAEDIVIQSFAKVFERHNGFRTLPALRAYLYKAVRNASLNYINSAKRARARRSVLQAMVMDEAGLENAQIEGELLDSLYRAVEQLPGECRRVMGMIYIDGMKYREVADAMQISIETVKSQRRYALDKLRVSMSEKNLLLAWMAHLMILHGHLPY